jgi:hypothetical protein
MRTGEALDITPKAFADNNAEGVRQFKPRVGAQATTLGIKFKSRFNPERVKSSEDRMRKKPFQG